MTDKITMLHCVNFFHYYYYYYLLYNILFQYFITVACFDLRTINFDIFLLGEFIQRLKCSDQTSDINRQTVLVI